MTATLKRAASDDYYIHSMASQRDMLDYYNCGIEPDGTWWNPDRLFGLEDGAPIDPRQFRRLYAGYSPDGREALTRNAGSETRRPGVDLTFSADKSVSALWAMTGEDDELRAAIEASHEDAVRAALRLVVHRYARWTRIQPRGGEIEPVAAKILGATFQHSTSRENDPQLHTHAVIFNVAQTEHDGKWRAFHDGPMRWWIKAAGAVYRSALAANLRERVGVRVEHHGARGEFVRIAGTDRVLEKMWSKRRQQILRMAAEEGVDPSQQNRMGRINLATRSAKHTFCREANFETWEREAAGIADFAETRERLTGHFEEVDQAERERALAAADAAPRDLTEFDASFALPRLVERVAQRTAGILAPDEALERAAAILETEDIVALDRAPTSAEARAGLAHARLYSTRDQLREELEIGAIAARLDARDTHGATQERIEAHVAAMADLGRSLSDEQAAAVSAVAGTPGGIAVVQGAAGAGKSMAMRPVADIYKEQGYRVLAIAQTNRAATALGSDCDIQPVTVARLLRAAARDRAAADERTLLIVDEAGLLPVRAVARLLRIAERSGAAIAFVGEMEQQQPIESGPGMRLVHEALAERHGEIRIAAIRRQRPDLEDVLVHRDGLPASARGGARARITAMTPAERAALQVERDAIVATPRVADVPSWMAGASRRFRNVLTEREVRAALEKEGRAPPDGPDGAALAESLLSPAARAEARIANARAALAAYYNRGHVHLEAGADAAQRKLAADWARYTRANPDRTALVMARTHAEAQQLSLLMREAILPPVRPDLAADKAPARRFAKVAVTRGHGPARMSVDLHIAVGDHLRVGAGNWRRGLYTGDVVRVRDVSLETGTVRWRRKAPETRERVRVAGVNDRGEEVSFFADDIRDHWDNIRLEYGYAVTISSAQGATVDRAFLLGDDFLARESAYPAMTRHRDRLDVYYNRRELGVSVRAARPEDRWDSPVSDADILDHLARAYARDGSVRAALDHASPEQRAALARDFEAEARARQAAATRRHLAGDAPDRDPDLDLDWAPPSAPGGAGAPLSETDIDEALGRLTRYRSTFRLADIRSLLAGAAGRSRPDPDDIESRLRQILADQRVLPLFGDGSTPEDPVFTTASAFADDDRILRHAGAMARDGRLRVDAGAEPREIARRLARRAEAAARAGRPVHAVGPTRQAALAVPGAAGVHGADAFLHGVRDGRIPLPPTATVLVNGAGGLDRERMLALLHAADRAGCRLVLADRHPAGPHPAFDELAARHAGPGPVPLAGDLPARDRAAILPILAGDATTARYRGLLAELEQRGALHLDADRDALIRGLARAWTAGHAAAPHDDRAAIAGGAADVERLNAAIQSARAAAGQTTGPATAVEAWQPVHTPDEREVERFFEARPERPGDATARATELLPLYTGDWIRFTAALRDRGIARGDRAEIVSISADAARVRLRGSGRVVALEPRADMCLELDYAAPLAQARDRRAAHVHLMPGSHWGAAEMRVALTRHASTLAIHAQDRSGDGARGLAARLARVGEPAMAAAWLTRPELLGRSDAPPRPYATASMDPQARAAAQAAFAELDPAERDRIARTDADRNAAIAARRRSVDDLPARRIERHARGLDPARTDAPEPGVPVDPQTVDGIVAELERAGEAFSLSRLRARLFAQAAAGERGLAAAGVDACLRAVLSDERIVPLFGAGSTDADPVYATLAAQAAHTGLADGAARLAALPERLPALRALALRISAFQERNRMFGLAGREIPGPAHSVAKAVATGPAFATLDVRGRRGPADPATAQGLRIAADAIGRTGGVLACVAPTPAARRDLADATPHRYTAARFLQGLEAGEIRGGRRLTVVVAEAGRIDTDTLHAMVRASERNGFNLRLLDDASMSRSSAFAHLAARHGPPPIAAVAPPKEFGRRVAAGDWTGALDALDAAAGLIRSPDAGTARARLVSAFAASMADPGAAAQRIAVAPSRDEAEALSRDIQKARLEAGQLGKAWNLPVERPRPRGADAERPPLGALRFHTGDVLRFDVSIARRNIAAGDIAAVTGVRGKKLLLEIADREGGKPRQLSIDTRKYSAFSLGYATSVHDARNRTWRAADVLHSPSWTPAAAAIAYSRADDVRLFAPSEAGPRQVAHEIARRAPPLSPAAYATRDAILSGQAAAQDTAAVRAALQALPPEDLAALARRDLRAAAAVAARRGIPPGSPQHAPAAAANDNPSNRAAEAARAYERAHDRMAETETNGRAAAGAPEPTGPASRDIPRRDLALRASRILAAPERHGAALAAHTRFTLTDVERHAHDLARRSALAARLGSAALEPAGPDPHAETRALESDARALSLEWDRFAATAEAGKRSLWAGPGLAAFAERARPIAERMRDLLDRPDIRFETDDPGRVVQDLERVVELDRARAAAVATVAALRAEHGAILQDWAALAGAAEAAGRPAWTAENLPALAERARSVQQGLRDLFADPGKLADAEAAAGAGLGRLEPLLRSVGPILEADRVREGRIAAAASLADRYKANYDERQRLERRSRERDLRIDALPEYPAWRREALAVLEAAVGAPVDAPHAFAAVGAPQDAAARIQIILDRCLDEDRAARLRSEFRADPIANDIDIPRFQRQFQARQRAAQDGRTATLAVHDERLDAIVHALGYNGRILKLRDDPDYLEYRRLRRAEKPVDARREQLARTQRPGPRRRM